jgi:hypothetical protein
LASTPPDVEGAVGLREQALDPALEVVGRDAELVTHVEPMRRGAVCGDAGVEVKALAAEARCLLV